jgi:peptidoglycan/xylan/chitin deacetylase (PgdA/CDA1 family)
MIRRIANALSRRTRKLWPRSRPAILMYHRLADESFDPWGLAVHPTRFAQQMEWLANNREVLPLVEISRRHQAGTLSPEAVAVTFDDGYACSAEVAAPLLNRLGIPATVFLPTELIRRGREFWWDELERIVLGCDRSDLPLNGKTVALGSKVGGDRNWPPDAPPRTERQKAFHLFWSQMRSLCDAEREIILDRLRMYAEVPSEPRHSHRPMSGPEARSLAPTTVEFGSHGRTHPDLTALSDPEKRNEIDGSIDDCVELTGEVPRAFAYPYGTHDPTSEQMTAEAGYNCACTAESGFIGRSSNSFALPRLAVGSWDTDAFRQRLLGAS